MLCVEAALTVDIFVAVSKLKMLSINLVYVKKKKKKRFALKFSYCRKCFEH